VSERSVVVYAGQPYMCIYICIYMYIRMYIYVCVYIYIYIYIYIRPGARLDPSSSVGPEIARYSRSEVGVRLRVGAERSLFTRVNPIYVYVYICMYVCTYTYMDVYICIRPGARLDILEQR